MTAIKERPILFSAPMVCATLEDRKTVTRREVKKRPALDCLAAGFEPAFLTLPGNADLCPYGKPGDRLWVRETFYAFGRWEMRFSQKKGRDEWHFVDMTLDLNKVYQFEPPQNYQLGQRGDVTPAWWKRPAIFTPRAASRILLEITDVRVERLQDISDEQALAEGIIPHVRGGWHWHPHDPSNVDDWHQFGFKTPVWAFHDLWAGINGQENWDANPWVWAVSFRRVTP
ncbi:hypothetical protein NTD84_03390 [Pseudomonas sp. 14P_8.1_Bac3]|uniref:hypothetical protein n=1 Tax=Pseudomonas sp. 14P_8.1_Bac3 TaxID=2971621 RepID=UPI0021C800AE|nr:hypothetical protein [Pseudomonas sp. 14P_8.1_Bac3]MCU1758765.1 hypothetical protein [Pseudomonas sp. 14P_8.1_Bac3]